MATTGLTIYDLPTIPPKWDRVGVFYVVFCSIWTTIVVAGMAFCWYNRQLPSLKVRALPLSFGAVIFLHLYWIMAQITYPIAGTMPVVIAYDVQYFVMGTWFPMGIALFHAANLQFLRVAELQRQFTHPDLKRRIDTSAPSSTLGRTRKMDYNTKVMTFICTGVVIQV
jgi:fatty acid desaturase